MSATEVSKAIGIDLGTTNSAVAIMNPSDGEIVIHRHADTRAETTPSCVWKDPVSGEITVGRGARKRIGTAPSPIRSIKRLMGREQTVTLTDEEVTPEEVSAHILAELKRQIEADVATFATASRSWRVDRAVVTVPAYFDQPSIDATRRAAEAAGLKVLDLLHEPTAAAAYHCWRTNTTDGLFLVYDLGGGTFDVSVLRSTAGRFEVLGISGNTRLGGDDLDDLVAQLLAERLTAAGYPIDREAEGEDALLGRALLGRMAENVKIGLSQSGEFVLRDAMGLRDAHGNTIDGFEAMFERGEIDALVAPTIARTIPPCFDALEQAHQRAGVTLADVDAIVLAGGSTHMPIVRELVRRNLCALEPGAAELPESELADPRAAGPRAKCDKPVYERVDAVVALGAAVRASATGGREIVDGDGRVRVEVRGSAATSDEETVLGGRVEALGPDAIEGATLHLRTGFGHEDEQELGPDGAFAFKDLPLQPGADNEMTIEIHGAGGDLLATIPTSINQDPDAGTVGAGATAVLARPLLVEVTRDGQRTRRKLVEALTSLPHEADFVFAHPGSAELVIVALYQDQRMIHAIHVPVDSSLPRGTPARLHVAIDELSFIAVRGSIGDKEFSASLHAPAPRAAPTAADLATLEIEFEEARAYLPAGRAHVELQRWLKGKAAYAAAVESRDHDGVIHEFEQLEGLVATLATAAGPLRPPKAEFDDKVAAVHDLNAYVARDSEGAHDGDEMQRNIEAQRQAGERAFADRDQPAYRDAIVTLDGYVDFLHKQLRPKPGSEISQEDRAQRNVEAVAIELARVKQIADAGDNVAIIGKLEELEAEVETLRSRAASRPDEVTKRTIAIANDLGRFRAVVSSAPEQAKLLVDQG